MKKAFEDQLEVIHLIKMFQNYHWQKFDLEHVILDLFTITPCRVQEQQTVLKFAMVLQDVD